MDTSALPSFGMLLRHYRLAVGLSQEALAERARLSVQAIGALERGVRRAPYRETVDLLAAALALTAEDRAQLDAAVARRRGPAIAATATADPATPPDRAITDLPVPITPFVGREAEQAVVLRLLASSRLLTLTGLGGIGKTRLAFQVAALPSDRHADGVRLVELAAVTDPTLVPQAIAQAVGVHDVPGRPILDGLTETLRGKAVLLLLDNCEHLRAAVGELATALLAACPRLRILATSRKALAVIGETVWWVPSMAVPDPGPQVPELPAGASPSRVPLATAATGDPARPACTVARLAAVASVRLFCERAAAAQAGFTLTDANADAVAAICRQLDGIPLALELAAAWTPVLTPAQIAALLDDRLRLLTGGVGLPARHQTLRASLDWSYELLAEPERGLLARLAAFVGGCSLDAAEGVSGETAPDVVLDRLATLVRTSLVVVERDRSVPRYRLLEPVRQYALERATAEEQVAARDAHLRWYVRLAERAERPLFRAARAPCLTELDAELANIRAALAWAIAAPRPELGMRLCGALHGFWWYRGHLREGRDWAERLLALPSPAEGDRSAARAKALGVAGIQAWVHGAQGSARRPVEESVAIWRALGDRYGLAFSLGQFAVAQADPAVVRGAFAESRALFVALGETEGVARSLFQEGYASYRSLDDLASATALIEEARRLFRARDDRLHLGSCAYLLGEIAFYQGATERARSLFDESLPLLREAGDQRQTAGALAYLGRIADQLGDTDAALALLDESQAIRQERGEAGPISEGLAIQAMIRMRHGELERAAALLAESLALERGRHSPAGIARILEGLAVVATARGDPRRAAVIFGAAQALREASGDAITPSWRALYDRTVAAARQGLGEDAFGTAWAIGRGLSLDAAIGEALEQVATTAAFTPTA